MTRSRKPKAPTPPPTSETPASPSSAARSSTANLQDLGRDPPEYKGLAYLIVHRNALTGTEEQLQTLEADVRRELQVAYERGRLSGATPFIESELATPTVGLVFDGKPIEIGPDDEFKQAVAKAVQEKEEAQAPQEEELLF